MDSKCRIFMGNSYLCTVQIAKWYTGNQREGYWKVGTL